MLIVCLFMAVWGISLGSIVQVWFNSVLLIMFSLKRRADAQDVAVSCAVIVSLAVAVVSPL